jgi:hypothetical protein
MPATLVSLTGSIFMLGSPAMVHAACSLALTEQIAGVERIVDSLRPDKAGQMRVFASNGSEFTSGQAQWMKGQLRAILRDCTKGDDEAAAAQLRGVQELLNAHRKP